MKQTNEIPNLNSDIETIETTEPTTATEQQKAEKEPTTEQNQTNQSTEATPTPKTTTAQINAKLWDACNTFRGLMDGSDYKDYILTMLFIKYLSDTYTEKITELKAVASTQSIKPY
ncbi:type I restriction-modification system subunit M N-terminal domain-containing protein [Campylobacter sp. RM5004]|uniref:type I restriction-modification system subunit M N-terminal domain-containing protein n=1 Tax=Campylobacter sp. RM5004 TaxID=1660078 RepID=UPI0023BAA950|nr:type I restriction-modification system subunit M N-terminal domain-containing protein [Campylobacter sp. RM5004]